MDSLQKDNENQKDNQVSSLQYDPILFHNDEQLYYIYKKIEGISGAIFLITNLVPDTEVLKATLRNQGLGCLDLMVETLSNLKINVSDLQKLSSKLNYIHSLLDIAFWSGIVSQMNSSLIQRQIGAVSKVVNDVISKNKSALFLDTSFFSEVLLNKGQATPPSLEYKPKALKDTKRHDKGQSIKDKKVVLYNKANNPQPHSSRRDAILKLLAHGDNLNVKDFLKVISDCSEKTIQRELLSLVSEGVIKKEGERRWSTYTMA